MAYQINRQPVRIQFDFAYTSRYLIDPNDANSRIDNPFFELYDALTKAAAPHCWRTIDNGNPDTSTWVIQLNHGPKESWQPIAQTQIPWVTTNPTLTGLKSLFQAQEGGLISGLEIDKYQAYFEIKDETLATPAALPESLNESDQQMTWTEWLTSRGLTLIERESRKFARAMYQTSETRTNALRDIECSILYEVEKDENVVQVVPLNEVPPTPGAGI